MERKYCLLCMHRWTHRQRHRYVHTDRWTDEHTQVYMYVCMKICTYRQYMCVMCRQMFVCTYSLQSDFSKEISPTNCTFSQNTVQEFVFTKLTYTCTCTVYIQLPITPKVQLLCPNCYVINVESSFDLLLRHGLCSFSRIFHMNFLQTDLSLLNTVLPSDGYVESEIDNKSLYRYCAK